MTFVSGRCTSRFKAVFGYKEFNLVFSTLPTQTTYTTPHFIGWEVESPQTPF